MMERSLSSKKVGSSAPQYLSFGASQQDRRRNSVNDHFLSSAAFTPSSNPNNTVDQNRRTHYSSLQEVRMFPNSSQQDQTTITASMSEPGFHSHFIPGGKSFINSLGGSPVMAPSVSVFPVSTSTVGTTDIRSSSKPIGSPPSPQLTIFYAGSVSVYQDISPEKAQAIMLLAGNGPQAKPVPTPKAQNLVPHSPAITHPPTMPSTSYIVSETGNGSNEVTGLAPTTKTMSTSFAFMPRNNQTKASNMGPSVGLPQSRKASLARFLDKRKDRVINVSPYYVDNKSSAEYCRTPMSECSSSSLSSSSAVRPI